MGQVDMRCTFHVRFIRAVGKSWGCSGGANSGSRRRFLYWVIIAAFFLFWIAIAGLGAPLASGNDVFVYKDAGCNLALGKGFISQGLPGTPDVEPHLFASNGPGVPFLFGLFAMAFGCNGYANTFFELIFAISATICVALMLQSALSQMEQAVTAALMGLAVPSGLIFIEADRPEMPAFAVFALACLVAQSPSSLLRHTVAPLLAGLCTLMFPFGGALSGLAVWGIATSDFGSPSDFSRCWKEYLAVTVRLVTLYLCPIAIVVAIYTLLDRGAWSRFVGNGFGHGSGVGDVFYNGYGPLLNHAVFSSGAYSFSLVLSSAIVACLVLYFVFKHGPIHWNVMNWILAFVIVAFVVLPVVLFPAENNYMAFARTGLLVVLATSHAPFAQKARRHRVTIILLLVISLANIPFVWLDALKQIQSKPSYVAASREAASFARVLGDIPPGQLVVVPHKNYFIYKPVIGELIDEFYLSILPSHVEIAGYAACYQGRLIDEPVVPMESYLPALFLYSRASTHYIPHLFSVSLSRHEWGWSCDNYLKSEASKGNT
jgi:hypothetical protein